MTFTIVGADGQGRFGLATATARSAVGGRCCFYDESGVVATQGMVSSGLAFDVLDRLARDEVPDDAIAGALGADPDPQVRQIAVIDRLGRTGLWTGAATPGWHGDMRTVSAGAAGNILAGRQVLTEMLTAFDADAGAPLAHRLVNALRAGERAGGDARGRQSAVLLVGKGDPWPEVDLRVDDHPSPADELTRLLSLWEREWQTYDRTGRFPPAAPPQPRANCHALGMEAASGDVALS